MDLSRLIAGIILIGISAVCFFALDLIGGLIIGIPFLIFGIVVLLNKNEDKIEQVNYKKLK